MIHKKSEIPVRIEVRRPILSPGPESPFSFNNLPPGSMQKPIKASEILTPSDNKIKPSLQRRGLRPIDLNIMNGKATFPAGYYAPRFTYQAPRSIYQPLIPAVMPVGSLGMQPQTWGLHYSLASFHINQSLLFRQRYFGFPNALVAPNRVMYQTSPRYPTGF